MFYVGLNAFLVPLSFVSIYFLISKVTLVGTILASSLFATQFFSYLLTFIVNPGVVFPKKGQTIPQGKPYAFSCVITDAGNSIARSANWCGSPTPRLPTAWSAMCASKVRPFAA